MNLKFRRLDAQNAVNIDLTLKDLAKLALGKVEKNGTTITLSGPVMSVVTTNWPDKSGQVVFSLDKQADDYAAAWDSFSETPLPQSTRPLTGLLSRAFGRGRH
jgi:hypothetical protein